MNAVSTQISTNTQVCIRELTVGLEKKQKSKSQCKETMKIVCYNIEATNNTIWYNKKDIWAINLHAL